MTLGAMSGQQQLQQKKASRVNGLLESDCAVAQERVKFFFFFLKLDVKAESLGDKASPGRPTDGCLDPLLLVVGSADGNLTITAIS